MTYVPDQAKVRDKMLYASTRATLTKDLGDSHFVDSMYGTVINEFTYEGYLEHKKHQKAEAPLTEREKELAEIKHTEANTFSSSTRVSHAAGVSLPISDEALVALKALSRPGKAFNLVQLSIDSSNETIVLASAEDIEADTLPNALPKDTPRFAFYAFGYHLGGRDLESIVFMYICPASSKIRERMLYSSSKAAVISAGESEAGLLVVKKLETNDPEDITREYLLNELYPPKEAVNKTFDRPRPPKRRNPRN